MQLWVAGELQSLARGAPVEAPLRPRPKLKKARAKQTA
jgi:hypothetical protein